jgi:maltose alpha-D-glucosyltransferase/alpha-amylase
MDSVYGYQVTNVESQTRNTSSLLHWTRRMIHVRKANPAFGLGGYRNVPASAPSVLAFLRTPPEPERPAAPAGGTYAGLHEPDEDEEAILCVYNLSQNPVATELDLEGYAGRGLRDIFGGTVFPAIGDDGRLWITLGSQGFFWLRVRSPRSDVLSPATSANPLITPGGTRA